MGFEWAGSGEMCILHKTVLAPSEDGNYVMVACDDRCPRH